MGRMVDLYNQRHEKTPCRAAGAAAQGDLTAVECCKGEAVAIGSSVERDAVLPHYGPL
jgi:hypothetical protein